MSPQEFRENDIAIIAASCVLPGALNPQEFWQKCLSAQPLFAPISDDRLKDYLFHESEETSLKITSRLACEIDDKTIHGLSEKSKLPRGKKNRLALYAERATQDLLSQVPAKSRGTKQDIIIGCMNPDTHFELQVAGAHMGAHFEELAAQLTEDEKKVLADLFERALVTPVAQHIPDKDHFFTTSILARMAHEHALRGELFLVDSACASSLSAIELAAQRLQLGLADFAVAGGFESNLGQASYLVFSSVGALARTHSAPFTKNSQGLVQSEGTVLFALKRLSDARKDGDTIHAVIRAVSGGGDGRSASLFQPNRDGQVRVYEKIYGKDRRLDYLEAHGTGTEVGDQTEAASISEFFKGQKLPVGSVKALIGHTKGAAGATGVLKCLHILKDHQIPASPAGESLFVSEEDSPYVNHASLKLSSDHPLRIGVNAFGFGGTNYHLLLEEYRADSQIVAASRHAQVPVGILGSASMPLADFRREDFFKYDCPFKLPPNSAAGIDKTQLAALIVSWEVIKKIGPQWRWIPKKKINVVSACTLGLDQVFEIANRLVFEVMVRLGESEGLKSPAITKLRRYINEVVEPRYAPINEDAATGILNNVIAGRVCNAFDLHGKSYNIDKDTGSKKAAFAAVYNELQADPDQIFIVISVEETYDEKNLKPERRSVTAWPVTSASFAQKYELHLSEELLYRE